MAADARQAGGPVALTDWDGGWLRDLGSHLVDQALLDSVQPGIDNEASVERTLGRPTFISQFGRKDWYYVSQNTKQAAFRSARINDQMLLRIRFDDKGISIPFPQQEVHHITEPAKKKPKASAAPASDPKPRGGSSAR